MTKRVLLCLSHSVEEHDQLKLLSELGYEVVSLGGYIDPAQPHDPKRPPLPQVPLVHEVKDAVDSLNTSDNLGNAQSLIPGEVLDWLGDDGVIIYHHYLARLYGQWDYLAPWRKRGGRVIWRTVGQSTAQNELDAQSYRFEGLEIVRYSPKERNLPGFVGEDALIRFYKDPDEWFGWSGEYSAVTNLTQELKRRAQWCNYEFYAEALHGLPAMPAGQGSELLPGGRGELSYEDMREHLRRCRAYLYTGTQPASYTLGLLEALMTGILVVSIGPAWMDIFPYGPELFEGHELVLPEMWSDDPREARRLLRRLLDSDDEWFLKAVSLAQRDAAIETFGKVAVGSDWRAYLGAP